MLPKAAMFFLLVVTFLVPNVSADPLPPPPPTDVTAVSEGDAINVTWSAPAEDVVAYAVYRSGEMVGMTSQAWFLDTSPEPLAAYTVTAWDDDGDESPPGGPAMASGTGPACVQTSLLPTPGATVNPSRCEDAAWETIFWLLGGTEVAVPLNMQELAEVFTLDCLIKGDGDSMVVVVGPGCAVLLQDLAEWLGTTTLEVATALANKVLRTS